MKFLEASCLKYTPPVSSSGSRKSSILMTLWLSSDTASESQRSARHSYIRSLTKAGCPRLGLWKKPLYGCRYLSETAV